MYRNKLTKRVVASMLSLAMLFTNDGMSSLSAKDVYATEAVLDADETFALYVNHEDATFDTTGGTLDFSTVPRVEYNTDTVIEAKGNKGSLVDVTGVYYIEKSKLTYDSYKNIANVNNNVYTHGTTVLPAGEYYLFYEGSSGNTTLVEIGASPDDGETAGVAKYGICVTPASLQEAANATWDATDSTLTYVATWDAVTKDTNDHDVLADSMSYVVSLYRGDSTEAIYTSDALTTTSLDLSSEIVAGGYGDYTYTVTTSAGGSAKNNYTESVSTSSILTYQDTFLPEITSYTCDITNKEFSATATDHESGIAAFCFAPSDAEESSLSWTTVTGDDAKKDAVVTRTYTPDTHGTICFYVKDAYGNVAKQENLTNTDSSVKVTAITYRQYYVDNVSTEHVEYLFNKESLTLPTANSMLKKGSTFIAWKDSANKVIETITPDTTEGFHAGGAYEVTAIWEGQNITFASHPENVEKIYDGESVTLQAALSSAVTYDTLSWQWYKKGAGESGFSAIEGATDATYSVTNVSDSGEYKVIATILVNDEEAVGESNVATVAITKRPLSVKVKDIIVSYMDPVPNYGFESGTNGEGEGFVGEDGITLLDGYTESLTSSYVRGTTVGSMPITYTGESMELDNYSVTLEEGTGTLTVAAYIVEEEDPQFSILLTPESTEYEGYLYTGEEISPEVTVYCQWSGATEVTPLTLGVDYTLSYGNHVHASDGTGEDAPYVLVAFAGNYAGSRSVPFAIIKNTYAPTVNLEGWKYGEEANTPSITTVKENATVTYYYTDYEETFSDTNKTTTQPEDAGHYYVWAELSETTNYDAIVTEPVEFTIEKRTIVITSATNSWAYDGNPHSDGSYELTGDGFASEDDFQWINISGSVCDITTEPVVNAISYKLTSSTNENNYIIETVEGELTITPATIEPPEPSWSNSAPGTVTWVAITRDNLNPTYSVSLYRVEGDNLTPVGDPKVTEDLSVNFLEEIHADSADEAHGYVAKIKVIPDNNNYTESEESAPTTTKYTVRVRGVVGTGVSSLSLNGEEAVTGEGTYTDYVTLFEGESASLTKELTYGYTIVPSVTTWDVDENGVDKLTLSSTYQTTTTIRCKASLTGAASTTIIASATDEDPYIYSIHPGLSNDLQSGTLDFILRDRLNLSSYAVTTITPDLCGNGENLEGSLWISIQEQDLTEENYYSNEHTNVSYTGSVPISEAGTYYIYVKDGSGNITYTYSDSAVTFYEIELHKFASGKEINQEPDEVTRILKIRGEEITLPANPYSVTGNAFKYWNDASDGIYLDESSYILNTNNVLYANWTDEQYTYTVHYYYQTLDESTDPVSVSYVEDEDKEALFNASYGDVISYDLASIQAGKEGMSLTGTPTGVENYESSITVTQANMELDLYYDLHTHTATYSWTDEESQAVTPYVDTYYYGQTFTEYEKPTASGYTFVGWNYGDAGQAPVTMPDSDLTMTGYFQANPTTYTIHYYFQNLDYTNEDFSDPNRHYKGYQFEENTSLQETVNDLHHATYIFTTDSSHEDEEGYVVGKKMDGFTLRTVTTTTGAAGGSSTTSWEEFDDFCDGSAEHTSVEGTVSETAGEELHVNYYYSRNSYQINLNVYKDAREKDLVLYGRKADETTYVTYPGGESDYPEWIFPYGYAFASEGGEATDGKVNGVYLASYFETYQKDHWTDNWDPSWEEVEKYTLATFIDWSSGNRPTTMPAGDVVITREYVSDTTAPYTINVYFETLTKNADGIYEATGTYGKRTSYERYGTVGETVRLVDEIPAGDDANDGITYITYDSLISSLNIHVPYEHNRSRDLTAGTDADESYESATGYVEGVIRKSSDAAGTLVLDVHYVRKVVSNTVTYHEVAADGTDTVIATTIHTGKWGTTYYVDPLRYFDDTNTTAASTTSSDGEEVSIRKNLAVMSGDTVTGTSMEDMTVTPGNHISNATVTSKAATNYKTEGYIVSYSGYYWIDKDGSMGTEYYTWPQGTAKAHGDAPTTNTQAYNINEIHALTNRLGVNNSTGAGNGYMHVYYAAQEMDQHYTLTPQFEREGGNSGNTYQKLTVKLKDSDVEAAISSGSTLSLTYNVAQGEAQEVADRTEEEGYTIYEIRVANKADLFQSTLGSGGEEYADYPGLGITEAGYSYGDSETLRTDIDIQPITISATYNYCIENSNETYGGEKTLQGTGTYYIHDHYIYVVDRNNPYYNGNQASYNYHAYGGAYLGYDQFICYDNYDHVNLVIPRHTSGRSIRTIGVDDPITDTSANGTFSAYYFDEYSDYKLVHYYDGTYCNQDGDHNVGYNGQVTQELIDHCSRFTAPDGYRIVYYKDPDYTELAVPFLLTQKTYVYGRLEKMPVNNWDYVYYKLPESITDKLGNGLTTITKKELDLTENTPGSTYFDWTEVADTSHLSTGAQYCNTEVTMDYTNEYGILTQIRGTRTDYYIDGLLVVTRNPNFAASYSEFTMDYTQYEVNGLVYDDVNTKNKLKAYCTTASQDLVAYFTRSSYTLTIDYDHPGIANNSVSTVINGSNKSLADPSRPGYTFAGWTIAVGDASTGTYTELTQEEYDGIKYRWDENSHEASFKMPVGDTYVTAKWTPAEFSTIFTYYYQDDSKVYHADYLDAVLAQGTGTVKSVILTDTNTNTSGEIFTLGETSIAAITTAYDSEEETYTRLYYVVTDEDGDGTYEGETASLIAGRRKANVLSDSAVSLSTYDLSVDSDMFEFAFANYQLDTASSTYTAISEEIIPSYGMVVNYYYFRSSSNMIRVAKYAADGGSTGLTITGDGSHYYGENITIYGTLGSGYQFAGYYQAADVLEGYEEYVTANHGALPDSLASYTLKEGLDLSQITPVSTELSYTFKVTGSVDLVAITDAGAITAPTLKITPSSNLKVSPLKYYTVYSNQADTNLTTSVSFAPGTSSTVYVSGYQWYSWYYAPGETVPTWEGQSAITPTDVIYTTGSNNTTLDHTDENSGVSLVSGATAATVAVGKNGVRTSMPVGTYVYRCVVTCKRKDNGRSVESYVDYVFSIDANDTYVTASNDTSYTYDSNAHKASIAVNSTYDSSEAYHLYFAKEVEITAENLETLLADGTAWEATFSNSSTIAENLPAFTDVLVDENEDVIAHKAYYYVVSGDRNFASFGGVAKVTIEPVYLTVEAKKAFTKIYDASTRVEGRSVDANGVITYEGDFATLSDPANGYYRISGILPTEQNLNLQLDFEAEFNSSHVNSANRVTLSNLWVTQVEVNEAVKNYNYRFDSSATLNLSGQIKPYPLEVRWIPTESSDVHGTYTDADYSYVYDGTEKGPAIALVDENIPGVSDSGDFSLTVQNKQTNVGDSYAATAQIEQAEGASYEPADFTFSVTNRPFEITARYLKVAPMDKTVIYNGSTQTMVKNSTVNEFLLYTKESPEAEWESYASLPIGESFSVLASSGGVNVGTYEGISCKNLKILDQNNKNIIDNYNVTYGTGTLEILPCPVAVSGIVALDKEYDGTTQALLDVSAAEFTILTEGANDTYTPAASAGLYGEDELSLDPTKVSGVFVNANAGEDKTVAITIDNSTKAANGSGGALLGADRDNYRLVEVESQTANTADITASTILTLGVENCTMVYGDARSYADYVLTYSSSVTNAGAADVINDAEHHATYVIKTYDGNTYTTVVEDGTSSDLSALDAGTYYIFLKTKEDGETVDGLASENYTLKASTTPGVLTIKKRPVQILSADQAKIVKAYDGTTQVLVEASDFRNYYQFSSVVGDSSSGVVNGDSLGLSSYEAVYANANVATQENGLDNRVNVTAAVLDDTSAANYVLTNHAFAIEGQITPIPLTIAVNPQTITYGEAIGAYTYTVTGAIAADQAALSQAVAAPGAMSVSTTYVNEAGNSNRVVGTYPITVNGDASYHHSNYEITYEDSTVTVKKRIVYYQADDCSIMYGLNTIPSYTGAFVTTKETEVVTDPLTNEDQEVTLDTAWVYGENEENITIKNQAGDTVDATQDGGYITFLAEESAGVAVSNTTPSGTYSIHPSNVAEENAYLTSENYEFRTKEGTLTINKYYLVVSGVEVLGKIYDGTTSVDADHIVLRSSQVNHYESGHNFNGITFTYYQDGTQVTRTVGLDSSEESEDLLNQLKVTANYQSKNVSDNSKVDVNISLVKDSYLDQRYTLLTANNKSEAITNSLGNITESTSVTQTVAQSYIYGVNGATQGAILPRLLPLYPSDVTILYGEGIQVVTQAPANGNYSLVKDRTEPTAEEIAAGDDEVGFAEGDDFSHINFNLSASITNGNAQSYEVGSDVGTYTMDLSSSTPGAGSYGDYVISYETGTLTVEQNTLQAPEVSWSEENVGTITWTEVSGIGNVAVDFYEITLLRKGDSDTQVSSVTVPATQRSYDFLETMRSDSDTEGCASYAVRVRAIASTAENVVGGTAYANVAREGNAATSEELYSAKVTVAYEKDAITQKAIANSSGTSVVLKNGDTQVASGNNTASYVLLAGESLSDVIYRWSSYEGGATTQTEATYDSGYMVASCAVSTGLSMTSVVDESTTGGYAGCVTLSDSITSSAERSVILSLTPRAADVDLNITEANNLTQTMYSYTGDARPVYEAFPTHSDSTEYFYTYEWYYKIGTTRYDASNLTTETNPLTQEESSITWDGKTFAFPYGMNVSSAKYQIYCNVTATRKDNGETASKEKRILLEITRAELSENAFALSITPASWEYGQARGVVSFSKLLQGIGDATIYYRPQGSTQESDWTTEMPTDVGSYELKAEIAESANYGSYTSATKEFSITQATLATPGNLAMVDSDTAPFGKVTWDAVPGPRENGTAEDSASEIDVYYTVTFSRGDMNGDNEVELATVNTKNTYYDFTSYMGEAGHYKVSVKALVANGLSEDLTGTREAQALENCADSATSNFETMLSLGTDITVTNGDEVQRNSVQMMYDSDPMILSVDYTQGDSNQTYQWYRNNVAVSGATTESLALSYVEESGSYVCIIKPHGASTQEGEEVYSAVMNVTITPRPITIVSATDTKTYDGTALTKDLWWIQETITSLDSLDSQGNVTTPGKVGSSSDTLVDTTVTKHNEVSGVSVTGTITDAGNVVNAISLEDLVIREPGTGGRVVYSAALESANTANYTLVSGSTPLKQEGSLTITSAQILHTKEDYEAVYDGAAHGITVEVTAPNANSTGTTEATVYYSESELTQDNLMAKIGDSTATTQAPTYTNAGTYTVYYGIVADNYTSCVGSGTVTIHKAEQHLYANDTEVVYDTKSHSITGAYTTGITNSQSDVGLGLVSYGSNNSRCDAGTTTVTVTGAATTNYLMVEDTADIIIARRGEDNGAVFSYTLTHGGVETVNNIYTYTGSAIAPTLVIQDTSLVVGEGPSATYYTLVEGTDYTIDAGSDLEKTLAGTDYTIHITFIGNFKGTGSVLWSIQDEADPVITTELADDGIYCGAKNFTVTDPNLLSVLVEQKVEDQYETFLLEEAGSSALPTGTTSKEYTLEGSSTGNIYRITATDVSGNQTIFQNITIYDAHSFTNYENLDATQQNLVVATCDHNCGATDTRERFWGRVNWNYEYSYNTTDPAHPTEHGIQGVEARSTRARVELVQTDSSQQTRVLATQMVSCEDRCGSSASSPANTGSEDFTFAYYDPQDPTKNPTSLSSGILRIPSQDEDGNPYTYAVKVTTLSTTGEAVSDYTIDYARDYASTPAPAAGDTVSITYQPNCFSLPWKVVITDLSSTEGVTVVPDGIYVKVLYSLPGEDQWSQDASYQIISQQADPTNLGVYCEKVEQQDGTYAYTGSYPVWQYVGGTTESYYHRIQVVSYVYQGHTYDVSGKNYRSIADADHVNHTVYYTGVAASGTILYELPEDSKNTVSEEFSMPVLIFDYNEGNDTTNLATPKTVEKIVKTDYTSEVTESEISSVSPLRENYSFLGWFSAAEEGEEVTRISPLSKTTTIYAHWRELVPPTGSIQVDTNAWNSFLHSITFGQFYANTMEVTITAEDTAGTVENSGVASIQYLLTDTGMDETEITSDQLTWTDYTGSFTIDPNAAYIIYAKILDHAGNVCYISSDGMILDDVAPVVTGVSDGATYCGEDVVIEGISDLYLSEALLDGSLLDLSGLPVTVSVDRTVASDVAQTHTLVTKDHAGNTTTITFTQYSDHLYRKDPVFTWSEDYETATATFICEYQEDHTKTLDCTITKEQKEGETLVTATVTLDGETYQDTKTIIDPEVLDGDTLIRLIIKVEDGVEEIPETLVETEFSTEEAILQEMLRVIVGSNETYENCNYALYDVELQISYDNGTTWALVTEEDFPREGISITLPYPVDVDPESHEFMASHMFTHNFHGHIPGEVETPEVHKRENGLEFVVTGLSPVMIAWRDTIVAESIDVSPKHTTLEGIGTTADLQAVITPFHADHAQVTWSSSDPAIATVDENGIVTSVAEGTVTITVTTADGKLSATAQVTVVIRDNHSEESTDDTLEDENSGEEEEEDESSIGSSAIPKTADPLGQGTLLGLLGMMMSSLAVFGWLFLDEKKKRMR